MKIGRLQITARGWPWQRVGDHWASNVDKTTGQRYGWNPFAVKGFGRFGGGWAMKLGIDVSSCLTDWVFYFGIGSIRIILKRRSP